MAVYFIQAGAYVKVGYSKDPIARSATVTRSGKRPADIPYAADTKLLGWVPGDRRTEMALHVRFDADWVTGEWYYLDPETAHEVIWADPAGIDFQRMSGLAVLFADKHPGATRAEMEAMGLPIMGKTLATHRLTFGGVA